MPGIIDLDELAAEAQGVPRIVLESVQDMLLKLALQMAHEDYEDRRERQRQGIELAKLRAAMLAARPIPPHMPASWPCAKAVRASRKRQGWPDAVKAK